MHRAVLLSGPRRVGKTTVLQQTAQALVQKGQDPKSILYLSLDHPLLKLLSLREILALFHESTFPDGKPATLLLDEIQYAPEWEAEIKLLIDHKPQYRVLATGSASVIHKDRLAESGVGRWITVPIPTLSFFEFVSIRNEQPANSASNLRVSNLFSFTPGDLSALAGKKVLKARNKYYLVDAALRNAVLLRGEEIYTNPEEMGTIVETTVLRHLFANYYRDTPEIVCWRDAVTQKEVDIIVRSPAYMLPFEVKYGENPQLDKKSGLGIYCASENPKQGYLVTKRDVDFGVTRLEGIETKFLKIPAYILCYLLGQS